MEHVVKVYFKFILGIKKLWLKYSVINVDKYEEHIR